eukprot:157237_1
MTSASQSASSSSMSGKSDVQSVPNDIAQDLADVLDNSKSTFVAVWQMDCACLSKVVPGLKMDRVKSLLAGIAMDSIRFENDVTVFAIDFMKSVFGRDMMRSFRSVFAIIQTERLLYAEVDYLFIRFPKQFMFLGRLIGRNMLRVKAAIEQIIDDDGFPIFDKEVDFEFYPEPVRVEFSDALFEQFSELTHEVAEAEVKKSRKNISLCRFKRKREVSSSRDERESQRRKCDEGTVCRSSNIAISGRSSNGTHNIDNSINLAHRGTQSDAELKAEHDGLLGVLKSQRTKLEAEASAILDAGLIPKERQEEYDSKQSEIRECSLKHAVVGLNFKHHSSRR